MKLPFRVLAVDDDNYALEGLTELLREDGYLVTPVANYEGAKVHLAENAYDLLITDVRLRSFNGLHLIMHCRREFPDMALIIMSGYDEPLMELEAGRYGAQYVRKPIDPVGFLKEVSRSVGGIRRQRRWPRKRVAGGFRVLAAGRPAAVTEIGYGGLRLEMPDTKSLPSAFFVEVAGIGLHLEVHPVWSYPAANHGTLICGAALASDTSPAARTWRTIVDRLCA